MIKKVVAPFALTAFILTALMIYQNFAPFGDKSFAIADATIQYIDFFQYWQRILDGDSSITFTFEKGLGGSMWAVVTYYLLSPFNLLLIFFKPENMHTFFDLIVVLKLSLSATTLAYYLEKRFGGKLSTLWTVLLATSFGLMEFNLHQARNIMWLDAVYMLPLMLLGVHKVRLTGKITFLTVTTALAILFNWYSGLTAAIFVGMFSIWEYLTFNDKPIVRHDFFIFVGKIAGSIILALALNAIQFMPTMQALSAGRGHVDWGYFNLRYFGRPLNIFQGLTYGSISEHAQVALFTGDLVTFGFIAFFLQKNINRRMLIGGAIFIGFISLMFYWRPLLFVFSLTKDVSSYWYRYSYLASFMMIYLTSIFLIHRSTCTKWRFKKPILTIMAFSIYPLIIFIRQFTRPINSIENTLTSLIVYVVIVMCFTFLKEFKLKISVTVLVLFGLCYNAILTVPTMSNENVHARQSYIQQQTALVNQLKEFDNNAYRTSQSRFYDYHRVDDPFAIIYRTANYNEGLAYGYRTISNYTSSPINAQLWFMDHLGYKKNGDNFNIINISVLPTDALLGVKYIFSDIPIEGVTPISELKIYNDNVTYKNDFAMPLAFVCNDTNVSDIDYYGNPFIYTNAVYSKIFGEQLRIYTEIPYQMTMTNEKEFHFNIDQTILKKEAGEALNGAIYGNMAHDEEFGSLITINGKWMYQAFGWMGVSAFYVPRGTDNLIHIRLETEHEVKEKLLPYFYIVDESELAKARDKAQARAAQFEKFSDHYVKMTVNGKSGEKLFTTIPYEGWKIIQNGRQVDAEIIADCFIGLTLDDGDNVIEMTYSMPSILPACAVTLLSLLLFIFIIMRRSNKQEA